MIRISFLIDRTLISHSGNGIASCREAKLAITVNVGGQPIGISRTPGLHLWLSSHRSVMMFVVVAYIFTCLLHIPFYQLIHMVRFPLEMLLKFNVHCYRYWTPSEPIVQSDVAIYICVWAVITLPWVKLIVNFQLIIWTMLNCRRKENIWVVDANENCYYKAPAWLSYYKRISIPGGMGAPNIITGCLVSEMQENVLCE